MNEEYAIESLQKENEELNQLNDALLAMVEKGYQIIIRKEGKHYYVSIDNGSDVAVSETQTVLTLAVAEAYKRTRSWKK